MYDVRNRLKEAIGQIDRAERSRRSANLLKADEELKII
jgi:hypothetical protein